jgi:hypothetical protein
MTCDSCGREVFRARLLEETKEWVCKECDPGGRGTPNIQGSVFPFTTMHIAGSTQKVRVQSLRHLRQLEAKHGVQSVAFNVDSKNWGDAPRGR